MTATPARGRKAASVPADTLLSERQLEQRASAQTQIQPLASDALPTLAHIEPGAAPAGPLEAIQTYREILATYPNYERNDQVLYQMSRAYDEIGQPDEAMEVMNRLVREYPHSKHVDEVHFRRGEYYFVRKKFIDAEDAYAAVITMGPGSQYYELALYKKGWALYKQYFYNEALDNFVAMLDNRKDIGFDFEALAGELEEELHRGGAEGIGVDRHGSGPIEGVVDTANVVRALQVPGLGRLVVELQALGNQGGSHPTIEEQVVGNKRS